MFDRFTNRLTITGTLVAHTALRVGTGRSLEPIGAELPVLRDELGRPVIPGASLKGVLRSYVESLVRAVTDDPQGACMSTGSEGDRCISPDEMKRIKRRFKDDDKGLADDDKRLAEEVWEKSCLVCRTFGSPWLASHVWMSDLPVEGATWFGQFQVRDGVAIDRDTGTVFEGQLYDYEVVPAGTRFECAIVAEGLEDWQLGMLWLGLQPLCRKEMAVGGFRSRGLGTVALDDFEARYFDLASDELAGRRAALLIDYVVSGEAGEKVEEDQARRWVSAFRREVAEQVLEEGSDAQTTD